MSVHLRIEETHDGVKATLSQRDDEGKVIGRSLGQACRERGRSQAVGENAGAVA